jgi:hypothetical protein
MGVTLSLAVVLPQPSLADPATDLDTRLEALRQADLRLATVAYRLDRANDALCLKHGPLTGLVLHGSMDYDQSVRPAVIRYFRFEAPIGIEGVVADSPAAAAGVHADDSLVAIDGTPFAASAKRADAVAAIDVSEIGRPITLALRRDGRPLTVTLNPEQGCLAHAEVDVSDDLNAATDGTTIQVDSGLMNLVGDDDGALAAIVAHELSHIVLDHPHRLTAAHVSRGIFKGFGRSARLFKQTEDEADRLSVTLMANAGYDPQAAVRYWLTYGPKLNDHGGLGSTHSSWRDRADLIARAVAAIPPDAPRPIIPAWIESRTQPLR